MYCFISIQSYIGKLLQSLQTFANCIFSWLIWLYCINLLSLTLLLHFSTYFEEFPRNKIEELGVTEPTVWLWNVRKWKCIDIFGRCSSYSWSKASKVLSAHQPVLCEWKGKDTNVSIALKLGAIAVFKECQMLFPQYP